MKLDKVRDRARHYVYKKGLNKEVDLIYFEFAVNAYLAGYKSAIREMKKEKQ